MKLLKPGVRLKSAVCGTEIMVIRSPGIEALLACGGAEMLALTDSPAAAVQLDPQLSQGSLIGKRFADPDSGLELLVTKAGEGSLAVDGISIPLKEAKPLPSSD